VRTLRIAIAVLALVAFVAGLLIPQPEVFAISGTCATVILLLGCGSIAADALPLRGVPLVCSILPVAVALIAQPFSVPFYAGVILVLQGVAWFGGRRLAVASA
jgi:hypothetical protein